MRSRLVTTLSNSISGGHVKPGIALCTLVFCSALAPLSAAHAERRDPLQIHIPSLPKDTPRVDVVDNNLAVQLLDVQLDALPATSIAQTPKEIAPASGQVTVGTTAPVRRKPVNQPKQTAERKPIQQVKPSVIMAAPRKLSSKQMAAMAPAAGSASSDSNQSVAQMHAQAFRPGESGGPSFLSKFAMFKASPRDERRPIAQVAADEVEVFEQEVMRIAQAPQARPTIELASNDPQRKPVLQQTSQQTSSDKTDLIELSPRDSTEFVVPSVQAGLSEVDQPVKISPVPIESAVVKLENKSVGAEPEKKAEPMITLAKAEPIKMKAMPVELKRETELMAKSEAITLEAIKPEEIKAEAKPQDEVENTLVALEKKPESGGFFSSLFSSSKVEKKVDSTEQVAAKSEGNINQSPAESTTEQPLAKNAEPNTPAALPEEAIAKSDASKPAVKTAAQELSGTLAKFDPFTADMPSFSQWSMNPPEAKQTPITLAKAEPKQMKPVSIGADSSEATPAQPMVMAAKTTPPSTRELAELQPAAGQVVQQIPGPVELSRESKKILARIPSKIDSPKNAGQPIAIERENTNIIAFSEMGTEVTAEHESLGMKIEILRPVMDTNEELSRAYDAVVAGQNDLALATYERVLSVRPDNINALFGKATLLHQAGDFAGARQYYERVLKKDADHPEALNNFLSLVAEESPMEALTELFKLQQKNPHFSPIPAQISYVYQKLNDYPSATKAMLDAHNLTPSNLSYVLNLAILMDRQGAREHALQYYQQLQDAYLRGADIPGNIKVIQERLTFIRSNR